MKKLIIIGAIIISSFLSKAQISFGPIVGAGLQGIRSYCEFDNTYTHEIPIGMGYDGYGNKYYQSDKTTPSPSFRKGVSYKLGVLAKIDIKEQFAISAGIAYQTMSSEMNIRKEIYKTTTHYMAVPILVHVQYSLNKNIIAGVGFGPEFNFLLFGEHKVNSPDGTSYNIRIKGKNKVSDTDAQVNADSDRDNDTDFQKPVNISLVISPSVQIKLGGMNLLVSPAYYIGLTNIATAVNYSSPSSERNQMEPRVYYFSTSAQEKKHINVNNTIKTGGFGLNVAVLFGGQVQTTNNSQLP